MIRTILVASALLLSVLPRPGFAADSDLVQFTRAGRVHTGLSLARNPSTWCILGTDGQLHYLQDASTLNEVKAIEGEFSPASAMEVRGSLIREFGPAFEVVATKHFLVVQPAGRGTKWPQTFEQLHLQFTHQLKQRGVHVRTGKFTMVAVVLPDRAALHAELDRQKIDRGSIAGIYINNSNRVYTYDSGDNRFTASILRHEAAHQSAFNSNIHSRLNETPKWITEGLGMLFESAAMVDGRTSGASQRAHAEAASQLLGRYARSPQSVEQDIHRLIAEDEKFSQSREIQDAYHVSWLMMFYLSERRPKAFAELLNHTASRAPFNDYPREERLADFERITGQSVDQFAVDAGRFLESIAR